MPIDKNEEIIDLLSKWAFARKKPLYCLFEITRRCNFRCVHCYINPKKSAKIKELSLDEIKKALDQLSKLKTLFVVFTGGEVFLRKDFVEILEYCKKKKIIVSIKSNGSLISEKIVKKIKKLPIKNFDISLYGFSEKTYKKITGSATAFEKVQKGISTLKNAGIPVEIVYVPLKENFGEAKKIKNFAKKNKFRMGTVPLIHPRDDSCLEPLKHSCSYKELADHVPFYDFSAKSAKKRLNRKIKMEPNKLACRALHYTIHIDPEGNIYPCMHWKKNAGNIRKNSIKNIWESSKVLKWAKSLKLKDLKECHNCKFINVCRGLCPVNALKCPKWLKESNLKEIKLLEKCANKTRLY